MDDKAAQAVRTKRDSSMRVGLKMVREGLASHHSPTPAHGHHHHGPSGPGKAAGFFTAGNTGAAMATAKMVFGMLAGVDRPALATILPTVRGIPSLLLDVGANVDSDPDNLVQFAVMGHMYAQNVLKIPNPRVGLLSIGEEDSKGNSTHPRHPASAPRAARHQLHRQRRRPRPLQRPRRRLVCDGFVGNVALKTCEGTAKLVTVSLRESLKSTVTSQVGALLSRKAFNDFKKRLDYSEYGGAPLLGVRGVCIVGHGSSNEKAIMNGIRVAAEFAQAEVNSAIEAALRSGMISAD